HQSELLESFDLLFFFSAYFEGVSRRKAGPQRFQLRASALHDFRSQRARGRYRRNRYRAELIAPPHLFRAHTVANGRNLTKRDLLGSLYGIDVEILDVGELSALGHSEARHDRNLLIALT